jgi:hypothetical protein
MLFVELGVGIGDTQDYVDWWWIVMAHAACRLHYALHIVEHIPSQHAKLRVSTNMTMNSGLNAGQPFTIFGGLSSGASSEIQINYFSNHKICLYAYS